MSEKTQLNIFFAFCLLGLLFMAYQCGREAENPCVEWSDKSETICSGAGDGFDCETYYPCIRRKYDKNTQPPKEAYDRIDAIEKREFNYDSFWGSMLQEQKRIDSLFDLIEKAERRKK